eukprot:scaffold140698_cov33-Tisochrysis_lutea.AAC.5
MLRRSPSPTAHAGERLVAEEGSLERSTNAEGLSTREAALVADLVELGQGHLFEDWPPGPHEGKQRLMAQLLQLERAYPGGLRAYIAHARMLLAQAHKGANPLAGWAPATPHPALHTVLRPLDADYLRFEAVGLREAAGLCFAVPAGGLGERLGFSGIKMALPAEITTGMSVLAVYTGYISALQRLLAERLGREVRLPLVIMTSADTHERTRELLDENCYFGLYPSQVCRLGGSVLRLDWFAPMAR